MAGSGGGVAGIVVDGTVCGAGCGAGCGNFGTDFCGTTGGIPLGTCPNGGRPAGGIPKLVAFQREAYPTEVVQPE